MIKSRPIGLTILAVYVVFTAFVIHKTAARPLLSNINMPYEGISTAILNEKPIHQVFTANRLAGVNLSLKNMSTAKNGGVLVTIGNGKTGEIYSQEIINSRDIPNATRKTVISVALPREIIDRNNTLSVKDVRRYYLELSTVGVDDGCIKTYVYKSDEGYIENGELSEYAIYFAPLESGVPMALVWWMLITPMLVIILFKGFKSDTSGEEDDQDKQYYPPKKYKVAWAILFLLIAFWGNGWINSHMFEKKEKEIPLVSDELDSGVALGANTKFDLNFTVSNNIDKIYLHFDEYPINLGQFTTWITDESGAIIFQADKDELSLSTGIHYAFDVSDVDLEKGKTYTLYLATSDIDINEEVPVLKGVGLVK